jgi:hypothetical protein
MSDSASVTPRLGGGRSAGTSDGNRDGNDGSHQRPEAAMNNRVLSHIEPDLGIRLWWWESRSAKSRTRYRVPLSLSQRAVIRG